MSIKVNAYDDGNVQLASVDFTTNMVWGAPKYGEDDGTATNALHGLLIIRSALAYT